MDLFRTIFLVVMVIVFAYQARRSAGHRHKQRAYGLAASAVVLLALLNILQMLGVNTDVLLLPFLVLIVTLLIFATFQLYRAWRVGEMDEQIARVRQVVANERERRRQEK